LKEVLSAGIDQIENMQQEAWQLLESFSEDTILKQAQRILAHPQNYTNEEIRKTANDIYKPYIKMERNSAPCFMWKWRKEGMMQLNHKLEIGI
jgi:hypothetical protein